MSDEKDRKQASALDTVVTVCKTLPAQAFLRTVSRGGAFGAVVDGTMGTLEGVRVYRAGDIDRGTLAKHIVSETSCGFLSSSAGTAGTLAVAMLTGAMGPASIAVGMGVSFATRRLYRSKVSSLIPPPSGEKKWEEEYEDDDE